MVMVLYAAVGVLFLWSVSSLIALLWCQRGDPPLGAVVLLLLWPLYPFILLQERFRSGNAEGDEM